MTQRIQNTQNPLAQGDPKEIARIIASLIHETPKDTRTPEEIQRDDEDRARRQAAYQKARYGELPEHTHRILEQGSFIGWYYELELDGKVYELTSEDGSKFSIFGDEEKAKELAREKIRQLIGGAVSDRANFMFIFGGQM